MIVITETRRLIMGKFTKDDAGLLFRLTGDKRVMRYFPGTLSDHETKQMLATILNQYEQYGYCFWKLLLKTPRKFIGIAGLLHQEIDGIPETEIAYRVMPEYWNNGYATEAAQACKEYAEQVLKKKKLISLIRPDNIASKRVAQKLGARKVKRTVFQGIEHDIYVY